MIIGSETEYIEFKKSTGEHREAVEAIAAILNKHGRGTLYFGVDDGGAVVGQEVSDKTVRQVGQWIADGVEPVIHPTIEVLGDGAGKGYIRVEFSGDEPPYSASGRYFIRVGTRNERLTSSALRRFVTDADNRRHPWDRRSSGKTVVDVDERVLRKYYERGVVSKRIAFEYESPESCLHRIGGLCDDGTLTNAAAVCFVPSQETMLRMGVLADAERVNILDNQQVSGTLFSMVDAAEIYIINNIRRAFIIDGSSLHRKEVPEIPAAAIRESLFNAFCHRDYQDSTCVQVDIYWDAVEIFNPGRFPEGVTPGDYLEGRAHESKTHNKLLADILYKSGDIETFATGLRRIKVACDAQGVPFGMTQSKTGVRIRFMRSEALSVMEDSRCADPDKTPINPDKTPINPDKTPINTNVSSRSDRDALVVGYVIRHGEASNADIAELLGLGSDRTKEILRDMVGRGLLVKEGDRKATRYRLAGD